MAESNPETSNATKVTIIVAIIGLIGTLGAAFFANADKIFPQEKQEKKEKREKVVTSDPTPTIPPPTPTRSSTTLPGSEVEKFVGHWANENKDTSGITRVEIDSRLDQIIVHMWGKCHPADCDWGTQKVPETESDRGFLQVTWNPGFDITDQQIKVLPDGRLEVAGHTHFTDKSGRPEYNVVEYFVRQ